MSSDSGNPGPAAGIADSGLSYVPAGWLFFVMAWSGYGLTSGWWLFGHSGLPDAIFYVMLAGFVVDLVTILWGVYLIGLALGRSVRFPGRFIIWQVATIIWLLARQAYVLTVPDFVFSARSLGTTAIEIGVGLLCIYLLRRGSGAEDVYARSGAGAPRTFVSIVAALLGTLLGAAVGAVAGLLAGSVIANVAGISCFEGGCGYFAALIGLAGLVIGAVAGGIIAVWLVRRRRRQPVAQDSSQGVGPNSA